MPLVNCSPSEPVRTKDTQPDPASMLASELFDAALTDARITSGEVSHLLKISESLVNRMRSANYREGVSFTQMLRLPVHFHLALHRAMNQKFGFSRKALLDLLESAGALAVLTK